MCRAGEIAQSLKGTQPKYKNNRIAINIILKYNCFITFTFLCLIFSSNHVICILYNCPPSINGVI